MDIMRELERGRALLAEWLGRKKSTVVAVCARSSVSRSPRKKDRRRLGEALRALYEDAAREAGARLIAEPLRGRLVALDGGFACVVEDEEEDEEGTVVHAPWAICIGPEQPPYVEGRKFGLALIGSYGVLTAPYVVLVPASGTEPISLAWDEEWEWELEAFTAAKNLDVRRLRELLGVGEGRGFIVRWSRELISVDLAVAVDPAPPKVVGKFIVELDTLETLAALL